MANPQDLDDYEFLDAVQKRIDKPQKWCKDQNRSVSGRVCLSQAVREVFPQGPYGTRGRLRDLLLGRNSWTHLSTFNDDETTTHKVLMQKFEEAKARTKQVH